MFAIISSLRPRSRAGSHGRSRPACSEAAASFDIGLATRLAAFCEASYCSDASERVRAVQRDAAGYGASSGTAGATAKQAASSCQEVARATATLVPGRPRGRTS